MKGGKKGSRGNANCMPKIMNFSRGCVLCMTRLSSLCNKCYACISVKRELVLVWFMFLFQALHLLFLFYSNSHFIHLKVFYKTIQEAIKQLMRALCCTCCYSQPAIPMSMVKLRYCV